MGDVIYLMKRITMNRDFPEATPKGADGNPISPYYQVQSWFAYSKERGNIDIGGTREINSPPNFTDSEIAAFKLHQSLEASFISTENLFNFGISKIIDMQGDMEIFIPLSKDSLEAERLLSRGILVRYE